MELTTNPMDFLDAKPFRKRTHYNPENYRTSIAASYDDYFNSLGKQYCLLLLLHSKNLVE